MPNFVSPKFCIVLELNDSIGQNIFLLSEGPNGIGRRENSAIQNIARLTRHGFLKLMYQYKTGRCHRTRFSDSPVLSIDGFPGINVPAGYDSTVVPFGVSFGGLKGSESRLIEIANSFEQPTKVRKPHTFKP